MTGRLIHYSDEPLTRVTSLPQSGDPYNWHGGRKPRGLWVSVEGEQDWREWCKSEDFRNVDEQIATEVILRADHNVLKIGTDLDMLAFHREYRAPHYAGMEVIDWPRVATLYQGIIIAPYRWGQRLGEPCSGWYYSWDCASGVIWDADAVAEVRPIERKQEAA